MCGSETLAMLVSSSSMKVASVTVTAMSQGLTAGFAADGAAATASGSETTCVLTSSLLVYAVNLTGEKMLTLYAATQNKFSLCGTGTGVPTGASPGRGEGTLACAEASFLKASTRRRASTPVPVPHTCGYFCFSPPQRVRN